ncbi:MAP6 domain-containing protein 1 [Nothoprocta perdicaria]|uniref:MAP6 domain-containing protein 1 n=1 Tax=Nothoprocta perdicaria TaxID=30464 RepID=UPI000E1C3A76|nr:MAP6 domain-containing protein 1 [Nothoprocta perdicaria]
MAWPCISRVCCLARFWNQLDKSDLSVPLTIHNYSDIEEQDESGGPAPPDTLAVKRSGKGGSHRKDPAGAAAEPFAAKTQYQQDFRAWPLQKRDAFPWIGTRGDCRRNGAPGTSQPAPSASVYVLPASVREERLEASRYSGFTQLWPRSQGDSGHTTSYRQEYRPWTGAKPSKPIKTKQGFIIPEEHFVQETSYKADFKIPEAKTKFSPNPSAVFQAPSQILNV